MRDKKKSNFGDKVGRNVQHQRESKKSFGYLNLPKDMKVLQLEDGSQRIDLDFLPYVVTDEKHPDRDPQYDVAVVDSLWYRRPFKVHRNVGSENETVVCLRSVGKKCPICEYREKKQKDGADKEVIKELYAKPRNLYVVIPLGFKKFEEVPTIWDMSDYLFQEVLNDELEASPEDRIFPDLEEGRTLSLKLKWKTFGGNSFPEVRSISFAERDPYEEKILDEVPNLDEVLKILSYETIYAKFFEEEEGGSLKEVDEDKEKDDKPVRSRRSSEPEKEVEKEEKPERASRSRRSEPEKEEKPERASRKSPEPEKEEEKPVRSARREREEAAADSSNKCPHGHKFGIDTEDFKECDTCDVWGKCLDKKEGK